MKLIDIIPSKRKFSFRTKDMKSIINSKWWDIMHLQCHVSQDAVKRYILEQEGKDVFEYSIFGDPTGQTKIGDFSC